jgi:UDP-glucose 4-epimerase
MAFHRFIRAGLDEKPVAVFGNGTQTRDFTFVSDIVEACTLTMEYDGEHSVFNVGGGTRIALNSALDIISGILPAGLDVRYEDRAKGDVSHTYADISLARGELGYAPKTTVEEGLAMEAEWLQATLKRLIGD